MIRSINNKLIPSYNMYNPSKLTMIIIALLMSTFFSGLFAKTWGTFTNTNNVTDVVISDQNIYTGTWGGVVKYKINNPALQSPSDVELVKVFTSVDGLISNDIRTMAYESSTGDVWAGSKNNGISIIKHFGDQVTVLDTSSVLPSNQVRKVLAHQSYVYVATDLGISQFYYLPGVYIPLLLHQYDVTSTQGGLLSNDVNDLAVSSNGYLYCATASGISYVHTDSLDIDAAWHKWTFANSPLLNQPILSITVNDSFIALNTKVSIHRHNVNPLISDWRTWTRANGGLQDSVYTVTLNSASSILLSYGVWNENTMSIVRNTDSVFGFIDSSGVLHNSSLLSGKAVGSLELPTESVYRFIISGDKTIYATLGQGIYINTDTTLKLENNCIGFQTISEIATDKNHRVWISSGYFGGTKTKKGTRGISRFFDGIWQTYTTRNSPLTVDNMMQIAIDSNDKKWFGSWYTAYEPYHWSPGVNVFDDENNVWQYYTSEGVRTWHENTGWTSVGTGTPKLLNNTISDIYVDKSDNILVSSSGAGTVIFDKEYNLIGNFQMPGSAGSFQTVMNTYDSGSRYFFGLYVDNKLVIWDDPSLPNNTTNHWLTPAPTALSSCQVYGVVTILNTFGEEENWIACSKGLYMWNGTDWYRYDTDVKRRKLVIGDTWENDTLYYVDEERLFGAIREALPSAIFLDPFNRIWVGSLDNGITMYDPVTERFTNYYQGKSPLISNHITCFGYDPLAGNLMIGTPEGLNTLKIGVEVKTEKHLNTVKAYPNPFFTSKTPAVRIVNLPSESMPKGTNVCKIYDSSGAQVIELKENLFARFDWNGLNKKNKPCSSGIYFFVVSSSSGETKRGKIALIRDN